MKQRTTLVVAPVAVVNLVSVADVEFELRAPSPDGVLDHPGKEVRIAGVCLTGIDASRNPLNEFGAPVGLITSWPIGVQGVEPFQDSRSMQERMNQRVDGDHAGPGFQPQRLAGRGRRQKGSQRHVHDLAGHAVDVAQRLDQGVPHPDRASASAARVSVFQSLIDPSDDIAVGHVPDEQEQRVGGLVKSAVPQIVLGQRTNRKDLRFGVDTQGRQLGT
mgnify:CR=1 FL=1